METIIGIDLGTTYSEVAILLDGRPWVIEEDGTGILPSVVGFAGDGSLLVGEPALNQLILAPERTVRSIKRRMGSAGKVRLGDREFTPPEISAMILRHLKERAERQLQAPVRKAVITVPAFFNESQRQATIEAGEIAGLEVARLLHEPTAASLVYHPDLSRPRKVMVYDLGGGTFDVSIVEIQDGMVEVRGSHGDTHLGGDDFDELLLNHVLERFEKERSIDLRQSRQAMSRLWRAVEKAKRRLSFHPYARIEEEFIAEKDSVPLNLSVEIARSDYEEMIRPLIERSMASVQAALKQAGLLVKELDGILLVGGSTRTPLVQEELKKRTGIAPKQEVHPDLAVALGAAVQAGMIAGEKTVSRVLVDITAHTFGIRCLSMRNGLPDFDFYSPIIPKGSPLPTTRAEVYATAWDRQEEAEIEVFQGEHSYASENNRIGVVHIQGLSKVPHGNRIIVQFQLTLDGTLSVTATEKATGLKKNVVIDRTLSSTSAKDSPAGLRREPMGEPEVPAAPRLWSDAKALEPEQLDTKILPPWSEEGVGGARDQVDATAIQKTIDKIRGLFETMTPDDREEAADLIEKASAGLQEGRLEEALEAYQELEEILFFIEESEE